MVEQVVPRKMDEMMDVVEGGVMGVLDPPAIFEVDPLPDVAVPSPVRACLLCGPLNSS